MARLVCGQPEQPAQSLKGTGLHIHMNVTCSWSDRFFSGDIWTIIGTNVKAFTQHQVNIDHPCISGSVSVAPICCFFMAVKMTISGEKIVI